MKTKKEKQEDELDPLTICCWSFSILYLIPKEDIEKIMKRKPSRKQKQQPDWNTATSNWAEPKPQKKVYTETKLVIFPPNNFAFHALFLKRNEGETLLAQFCKLCLYIMLNLW